jgi:hypothetical protein
MESPTFVENQKNPKISGRKSIQIEETIDFPSF